MKIMVFNSDYSFREMATMRGEYKFKIGDKVMIDEDYLECTGYSKLKGMYFFKEYTPEKLTYTGKEILDLILEKKFKEGDKIIATQEDSLGDKYISSYTYKHIINNDFEFQDDEFKNCGLDVFDLVCCIFEIVDMDEQNDKTKKLKELQEKRRKVKDEFVDLTNQIDKLTGAIK